MSPHDQKRNIPPGRVTAFCRAASRSKAAIVLDRRPVRFDGADGVQAPDGLEVAGRAGLPRPFRFMKVFQHGLAFRRDLGRKLREALRMIPNCVAPFCLY